MDKILLILAIFHQSEAIFTVLELFTCTNYPPFKYCPAIGQHNMARIPDASKPNLYCATLFHLGNITNNKNKNKDTFIVTKLYKENKKDNYFHFRNIRHTAVVIMII